MTTNAKIIRPATSSDVAKRAGVSRSTVSNILNGNDVRFPEATRAKVIKAAKELAYQPSLAGRSLVSGRSDTVVVLVPNTSFGSNLQSAVDQMVLGTRKFSANVVVRFASEDSQTTLDAVTALRPLALVDFGVLSRQDRGWLEDRGTIIVPSRAPEITSIPDGGMANIQGEELIRSGKTELWFAALRDDRYDPYGPGRYDSLRLFCANNGLAEPKRVEVELSLESGMAALRQITASGQPAGVACYNDDVGLTLLAAARELEVAVPAQVGVIGVDHTFASQLWKPRLTTIDTDMRSMVSAISKDLEQRLQGGPADGASTPHLNFHLVPGEST